MADSTSVPHDLAERQMLLFSMRMRFSPETQRKHRTGVSDPCRSVVSVTRFPIQNGFLRSSGTASARWLTSTRANAD
jgi:hypothetical protein